MAVECARHVHRAGACGDGVDAGSFSQLGRQLDAPLVRGIGPPVRVTIDRGVHLYIKGVRLSNDAVATQIIALRCELEAIHLAVQTGERDLGIHRCRV